MVTTTGPAGQDRFVDVSGRRLHARWLRPDLDSTPLAFLHEGLGSVELWRGFAHELVDASRHPGLLYSRYGNGWSDPLREPRPVDYMHHEALQTLPAILDRLDVASPILIGHSDGASISLIHAGAGHGVGGLILIAPHVSVEERTVHAIESLRSTFPTSDLAEKMAKYHRDPKSTFFGWADVWLSSDFAGWTVEEYLVGVRCPVLLIQSEDDAYGSTRQLDAIEAQVTGPVERLIVAGDDHAPHLSDPRSVLEATTRFITELDGSPHE